MILNIISKLQGISVTCIEKWPSPNYTISIWFLIESFQDPTNDKYYEPRLFSFLNKNGSGIEAFFIRRHLFVRTNDSEKTAINFTFETHKWYHLVVTQFYRYFTFFIYDFLGL
jgi:hypothetical protein